MKVLLIITVYLFIGGYVGAKVYRRMEEGDVPDRVISTMAALGCAALWPLVIATFIVWVPIQWWLHRLNEGGE